MKKIKTWQALTLIIMAIFFTPLVFATSKPTSKLIDIKLSASPNKSNVTFTLVGTTPYQIATLTKPHRLILDLDSSQLNVHLPLTPAKTLLLQRITQGPVKKKNALRIILELNSAVKIKSFVNNSADKTQLLLELTPQSLPQVKLKDKKSSQKKSQRPHKLVEEDDDVPPPSHKKASSRGLSAGSRVVEEKPIKMKSRRNVIVVIDPGHGGKDPGARGPRRSNEKQVVLAISKELQRQLNTYPGIRAVLTRNGDYFLDLRRRLHIARKYKAELFIAIHADAAYNNSAHGASVFALSQRGASSEAARWLAEKENYSELGQVSLDDKNYQLRSVLLDLSQTATINQSLQVGQAILQGLERVCTLHCRRVEQARFVVLKSPDIPSLLVETGFISNPKEEWRLNSPAYQRQLAQAMAQGIKAFFWRNPPLGSVFYPRA